MQTIQVVLDAKLLKSADRAAKRLRVNRSALIREALKAYLKGLQLREMDERDRRGYLAKPQDEEESRFWAEVAAWPD